MNTKNNRRKFLVGAGIVASGSLLASSASSAVNTSVSMTTVETYDELRGLNGQVNVGDIIKITSDGIAGDFIVRNNQAIDNGGTIIDITSSQMHAQRLYQGPVYIEWFGGIGGNDEAHAVDNADALERAIDAVASQDENGEFSGGEVNLGNQSWVFAHINITKKNRWCIKGNNTKVRLTDSIAIAGCAFWSLESMELQPTVDFAHDCLILNSSGTRRNARFHIDNLVIGKFSAGIRAIGDISQGTVTRSQFGNNTKSIYVQSNVRCDHILFDLLTFADHLDDALAFDCRGSNWALTNSHFETNHNHPTKNDIYALGQSVRIQNNTMIQSGKLTFAGDSAKIENNMISNSSASSVINITSGNVDVNNNTISWGLDLCPASEVDCELVRNTYGEGKTAIDTSISLKTCSGNNIKSADIGIRTANGFGQSFSDNRIENPIRFAYELINGEANCISNGVIKLVQPGSIGVKQIGGNAKGDRYTAICWSNNDNTTRYQIAGMFPIIDDSGEGSPQNEIPGGKGSTWRNIGTNAGSSLYVKESLANVSSGWRALL